MAFLTSDDDMQYIHSNIQIFNRIFNQAFNQKLLLRKRIKLNLFIFVSAILFSTNSSAEVYRPTDNQVVASWDTSQSLNNTRVSLQNVEWHLQQSQYAGSSNLHLRQASMMLDGLLNTQADKPEYWYYKARVLT
jgi:hypothetical protein